MEASRAATGMLDVLATRVVRFMIPTYGMQAVIAEVKACHKRGFKREKLLQIDKWTKDFIYREAYSISHLLAVDCHSHFREIRQHLFV